MRIAIVTQDEPFYLPKFFERLVRERKQDIVAIINLKPFNETFLDSVSRAFTLYGFIDFIRYGFRYVGIKCMDMISRIYPLGGPWSVLDVARREKIPVYQPENINEPGFLSTLSEEIKPDLIASVAASQVFKEKVLTLPSEGCINIHTAPLPRYRGMFPSFWVLHNGESKTAVTVHYMTEELDDGDIIRQKMVPISTDDTLESLIRRTKQVGVEVLLRALEDIELGNVERKPNVRSEATYYSFPTKEDVKNFRSIGRKFR